MRNFIKLVESGGNIVISEPERMETAYGVEVDNISFLKIMEYENENSNDTLLDALGTTNAIKIDYDGMYGSVVYYTLSDEDDTPNEHETIRNIIRAFLQKCYEFQHNQVDTDE